MIVCMGWMCDRRAECALHTSNSNMIGRIQFFLPERKGEFCEQFRKVNRDTKLQES